MNKQLFLEFIEGLKPLNKHECYYVHVLARKKYIPDLPKSQIILNRFIATNKFSLKRKLLEAYRDYNYQGLSISKDSLAFYMTHNPRDLQKSTMKVGKLCWDIYTKDKINPIQECYSIIQETSGKKLWLILDIDSENIDIVELRKILFPIDFKILETNGGYHLFLNSEQMKNESKKGKANVIYLLKNKYKEIDMVGDFMSPIPGLPQGNFIPKFK